MQLCGGTMKSCPERSLGRRHLYFVTHESQLINSHKPARKDFFFRVDTAVKAMLAFWTVGGTDQTHCGVFS